MKETTTICSYQPASQQAARQSNQNGAQIEADSLVLLVVVVVVFVARNQLLCSRRSWQRRPLEAKKLL